MLKPAAKMIGVWCIGVLSGMLILAVFQPKQPPPNLNDPNEWMLIKRFYGTIDPHDGEVTAKVYVIHRLSGVKGDGYTVLQNKIEVTRGEKTDVFKWPDNRDFAAGDCEIVDLDGDGIREFVLGGSRVVSYSQGRFRFTPELDELFAGWYDPGPFDLEKDGHLTFVDAETLHDGSTVKDKNKYVPIPRLKQWTHEKGFTDVSKNFPDYYMKHTIPEFEKMRSSEKDGDLQQLYTKGIAYITEQFLSKHQPASKGQQP
jgi:hypothetical protein